MEVCGTFEGGAIKYEKQKNENYLITVLLILLFHFS